MIVLGRVAAVLFCLELAYLAIGNLLLRSQAIQRAVGAADGFALEFGRAYTLWPGHAHVRDLSLRVEDYNVQFEVAIASAELDVALSELAFKKFHITRLDAQGTRFRMRHKLIAVGDDQERVAAYPKIKGFADPPYFVGIRAPGMVIPGTGLEHAASPRASASGARRTRRAAMAAPPGGSGRAAQW